jgi:hypothetical protein
MLPSNNPGFYPQILGLPADFLFNQGKSHVQNYGFPSVNSEETMKNKSIYIYTFMVGFYIQICLFTGGIWRAIYIVYMEPFAAER